MGLHVATAAVVKVSIGSTSGNRVALLVYRGDLIPEAADTEQVDRLLERGLIAAVEVDDEDGEPINIVGSPIVPGAPAVPDAVIVPAGTEGVEVPEGAPEKAWTHAQIDAWAARQSPPIALEADASKDVKLAAIAAIEADKQS